MASRPRPPAGRPGSVPPRSNQVVPPPAKVAAAKGPRPSSAAPGGPATAKAASSGASAVKGILKPAPKAAPPKAAPRPAGGDTTPRVLRVFVKPGRDDSEVHTLLGEYKEKGMNHGRKFYKKDALDEEDADVFMYFWDDRDGPDFNGWWFGDDVGGRNVWGRASSDDKDPPTGGWSVPWEQPPSDVLCVEAVLPGGAPKAASKAIAKPAAKVAASPTGKTSAAPTEGLTLFKQVSTTEEATNLKLEEVKEMLDAGMANEEEAQEAENMLRSTHGAVQKVVTALKARMENASGPVPPTMSAASTRLQALMKSIVAHGHLVRNEMKRLREEGGESQQQQQQQYQPQRQPQQQSASTRPSQAIGGVSKAVKTEVKTEPKVDPAKEERDNKAFQDYLPQVMELVEDAEDAVETVTIMAAPLSVDDDLDESGESTALEIQQSAAKAGKKLNDAKRILTQKQMEAKRYAPAAKEAASTELAALVQKLNASAEKLAPLKNFRAEYEQRVKAKKAIEEITMKLSNAELEVEKAHIMTAGVAGGQMSEDEIKSAAQALKQAQKGIEIVTEATMKWQDNPGDNLYLKVELEEMAKRIKESKGKLSEVQRIMKTQREGLKVQDLLFQANDAVHKVEDTLLRGITNAEMTFVKDVEDVGVDQALKAIKGSEACLTEVTKGLSSARTMLATKTTEIRKLAGSVSDPTKRDLQRLKERLESLADKQAQFKKETDERKRRTQMQVVEAKVAKVEADLQAALEITEPLRTGDPGTVPANAVAGINRKLQEMDKQITANVDAALLALTERKRDRDVKGHAPSEDALQQLQKRFSAAQLELTKNKKAGAEWEKKVAAKGAIESIEKKIRAAEEEVEKAGERCEDGKTADDIVAMGKALEASQTKLDAAVELIKRWERNIGENSFLKTGLEAAQKRSSKIKARLSEMKRTVRTQRESLESKSMVEKAKEAVKKAEGVLVSKTNSAEGPFLKGLEVLPLDEARDAIKESEAAAEEIAQVLTEARNSIAEKIVEARRFAESVAKSCAETLNGLSEKTGALSQKLSQFRKDTENRKRAMHLQSIDETLQAIEADVKHVVEIGAPLAATDSAELSSEKAMQICREIGEKEGAAQERLEETKGHLSDRKRDSKASAEHEDTVKKLQKRCDKLYADLAKTKKLAGEWEQKFVSARLNKEATALVKDAEEQLIASTKYAEPLTVAAGAAFLAMSNLLSVVDAWRGKMRKEDLTTSTLFEKLHGGAGSISHKQFNEHIEKMPAELGREDLTFLEEQVDAMFKEADRDGSGEISLQEFEQLFCEKFTCVSAIAMTDGFDISSSKITSKLELDEVVLALSEPKALESLAVTRLECKVLSSGATGWVTLKSNKGTKYLEACTPYNAFLSGMERHLESATKAVSKAYQFVKTKVAELGAVDQGPLLQARKDLSTMKTKATSIQKQFEDLKKKCSESKKAFSAKQEAERSKQQDARDRKLVSGMMSEIEGKAKDMEAALKSMDDHAKQLPAAPKRENFPSPISLRDEAQALGDKVKVASKALRSQLHEHQGAVAKASRGPLGEAKKSMAKWAAKADKVDKQVEQTMDTLIKACDAIAEATKVLVCNVMREHLQKRDLTVDGLFDELAGGARVISEEKLCSTASELVGEELPKEHALLFARQIAQGGPVSRRSFCQFLQQYFKCVKAIAITNTFEIKKSETLRKLDVDEVVECLEGPQGDATGVQRIRGKSLLDGTIGWITVKGNQGTPFLKEVDKPYIVCQSSLDMEEEFSTESPTLVRRLREEEVMEVLEGPRKASMGEVLRGKVKACTDGATGWITVRDGAGTVTAAVSSKLYACTATIAMTDGLIVKKCKALRKLEAGEVLKLLEGPSVDEASSMTRIKALACKDGLEGWVTIKGNQGTKYAEPSKKHYELARELPLQKTLRRHEAETVRALAGGEIVELLDGPKEEKLEATIRYRGRAVSDGSVGWVSKRGRNLLPWTPHYECSVSVTMHDAKETEGAKALRRIEAGEVLDLLEGPTEAPDGSGTVMRLRGRAQKDGLEGWVSIRGSKGTQYLSSMRP